MAEVKKGRASFVDASTHANLSEAGPGGITREEFKAYERVRESGETNMFDARMVELLSDGVITREKLAAIMQNYGELCKFYPGVRKE